MVVASNPIDVDDKLMADQAVAIQHMVSEVSRILDDDCSPRGAYDVAREFLMQLSSNEEIDLKQSNLLGKELLDMLIEHDVPATLVKLFDSLYKSGISGNYNCAFTLMKDFIDLIWKIALEKKCFDECASVIVVFRKQLGKSDTHFHMYPMCQITLKNVLEKKPDYAISLKYGLDTIADIFPFLQNCYDSLDYSCRNYQFPSADYSHSYSSDFRNFSRVFCNAIKQQRSYPISLSSLSLNKEIISFLGMFDNLLERVETILQNIQGLVKNKAKEEQIVCISSLTLFVLEELNCISKIYNEDVENKFWSVLKNRQNLLCTLICRYTERTYDHLWLVERKDVITSECRMLLAKKNVSELHMSKASHSVDELVNWSKPYKNLSTAIEKNKEEGIAHLKHVLRLICYFLLHKQHLLFRSYSGGGTRFYPNPELELEPYLLLCFELVGKVIALGLLHEVKFGVTFDGVFLRQLVEENIPLKDIKIADPSFYTKCKVDLNMDDDQIQHHFVTSNSKKVSFFERGFISVFGLPIKQLLSIGNLELGEINMLLRGSKGVNPSAYFQNNDANGSDLLIAPLLKVPRRVIANTKWKPGKELGKGSFGSVYVGLASDSSFFAVKEIDMTKEKLEQVRMCKDKIMQEVRLLRQLDHPNIIKILDMSESEDETTLYIFLELVNGPGTLAEVCKMSHLEDSDVSFYAKQILEALHYLHELGVAHRDIKCENILLDQNGCVKIIDFGLAKVTDIATRILSNRGSEHHKAPEVCKVEKTKQGYGIEVDIWSFGCTVLEMFTGKPPNYCDLPATADPKGRKNLLKTLINREKGRPPSLPENLSKEAKHFISLCRQVDPKDRPIAADLLKHPFITRYSLENLHPST